MHNYLPWNLWLVPLPPAHTVRCALAAVDGLAGLVPCGEVFGWRMGDTVTTPRFVDGGTPVT